MAHNNKIFSSIYNFYTSYSNFFFLFSLFSFIFYRLNFLLKLNLKFLTIFFIVFVITLIISLKIEIFSKIIKSNVTLNYIFYRFLLFKENFYEILFTDFNFSFKEKLWIFFSFINFGALISLIFYRNIDYIAFNIIFFLFFFFYKILSMIENFIINKYFTSEDLISYENIQKKLNIDKNLKFPYQKKNLFNIHRRFFVLPVFSNPASSTLRKLLKDKAVSFTTGLSMGTLGFYMYDGYHKEQDRKLVEKNYELSKKNYELSKKNYELSEKKIQEEIYINKYKLLEKKKNEAELIFAESRDNSSFFNKTENKKEWSLKKIHESDLAIEALKKDAQNDGIKIYSVIEYFFF